MLLGSSRPDLWLILEDNGRQIDDDDDEDDDDEHNYVICKNVPSRLL